MYDFKEKHASGVDFFRLKNLESLNKNEYFKVFKYLLPLLRNEEFNKATPAFYLNYITNPDDNKNSLRITYFTINPEQSVKMIMDFVNEHSDEIALFDSIWTSRPSKESKSEIPTRENLKFFNFLNWNTRIVMDMIESHDIQAFQNLVNKYRYEDLPNKVPPQKVFEDVFSKHSSYFTELKNRRLDQEYWKGLVRLFNGRDFGLHFLVNMMTVAESPYDRKFFDDRWCEGI